MFRARSLFVLLFRGRAKASGLLLGVKQWLLLNILQAGKSRPRNIRRICFLCSSVASPNKGPLFRRCVSGPVVVKFISIATRGGRLAVSRLRARVTVLTNFGCNSKLCGGQLYNISLAATNIAVFSRLVRRVVVNIRRVPRVRLLTAGPSRVTVNPTGSLGTNGLGNLQWAHLLQPAGS